MSETEQKNFYDKQNYDDASTSNLSQKNSIIFLRNS